VCEQLGHSRDSATADLLAGTSSNVCMAINFSCDAMLRLGPAVEDVNIIVHLSTTVYEAICSCICNVYQQRLMSGGLQQCLSTTAKTFKHSVCWILWNCGMLGNEYTCML